MLDTFETSTFCPFIISQKLELGLFTVEEKYNISLYILKSLNSLVLVLIVLKFFSPLFKQILYEMQIVKKLILETN